MHVCVCHVSVRAWVVTDGGGVCALAVISGLSTAVPKTIPRDRIASVEPIVDLYEGRASESVRLGCNFLVV